MHARATPPARRLFQLVHLFSSQFGSPQPFYTDSTRNLNWLLGGAMECVLKHLATSCFLSSAISYLMSPRVRKSTFRENPFWSSPRLTLTRAPATSVTLQRTEPQEARGTGMLKESCPLFLLLFPIFLPSSSPLPPKGVERGRVSGLLNSYSRPTSRQQGRNAESSSIGITWDLVRNVGFQAPSQT